jgi:hypothetical protein
VLGSDRWTTQLRAPTADRTQQAAAGCQKVQGNPIASFDTTWSLLRLPWLLQFAEGVPSDPKGCLNGCPERTGSLEPLSRRSVGCARSPRSTPVDNVGHWAAWAAVAVPPAGGSVGGRCCILAQHSGRQDAYFLVLKRRRCRLWCCGALGMLYEQPSSISLSDQSCGFTVPRVQIAPVVVV